EALPSIASVSRFLIGTRRAGDAHGVALEVDGGRVGQVVPKQLPLGTVVEVRGLFYNVPARRKFLRAERTELGQGEEWLRSLARARAGVRRGVRGEGERWPRGRARAGGGEGRFADGRRAVTLGGEFAGHALRVEHAAAGLRLHGWIAQPAYSRASADQQYLF